MIHLGKNTKSKIISKGISAGFSDMTYRGLVDISSKATNSNNYTQCDSLLMGNKCGAHTVPYIKNKILNQVLLMRQQPQRLAKSNYTIVNKEV